MADLQRLMDGLSPEKRALLERRIIQKRAAAAAAQIIPRRTVKSPCPLSFAQELMWLLDNLIDTSAYYVPRVLRLKGRLNTAGLESALNRVVERHEILRTTYRAVDGTPMQFIAESAKVDLQRLDLSHLERSQGEAEAHRILVEEGRRRFDLSHDLLLRALLLRLAEQEHILLLVSHHIASDGQSKAVLFRELGAFYQAYASGKEVQLSELPIQYADFAVWQREWMQGEVLEKHLNFWKAQLADAPMMLEVPLDRPRPAFQSFQGARQIVQWSNDTLTGLKKLSRCEGTTLFMTTLAAFGILLYRWCGQEDILIGTPVSGRSRTELESLIGYFSNSVVLRVVLSGDPTFRELMQRVKQVSLNAYSYQNMPFEKLVTELQQERDLSHSPIYQVMFSVGEQKDLGLEIPGLEITPIILDRGTAKFDMTLGMTEYFGDLLCNIEYCSALFKPATMERLAGYFQNLLHGILADPDQRISKLPMLSVAERQQILLGWNQTARNYSQDRLVHQIFESQAATTPDAIAVVYEEKQLTYRELNTRANHLAHFLKKHGVGPEVPVALCMDRSLDMIVGVMGILKAGGAYVPLDSTYGRERLPVILQDAECPLLLTQHDLLGTVPNTVPVIALDRDWNTIAQESQENPDNELTPATLAYIVYTSGSTGIPKGVMVSHRNLLNAYQAWEEEYQLRSPVGSHLQMANFSFDVFSGDLVRALCSGSKLVVCPTELLLNPSTLYSLMLKENVDCAEFVPAVLRALVDYLDETGQKLDFMRLLIAGSDTWTGGEYRRVLQLCGPKTRLINSYGVAEATIDSTYFEAAKDQELRHEASVPIGRPFPNTQVYVLDGQMQPAPVGVAGTLYVGGTGVTRGYLKRPELTAEKFVCDPFRSEPEARLYNTGDAARYLADGNIEFLGRSDNQVKIRGFRIELGEIETVIAKYSGVQQVVVAARELSPGQLGLVAYIVPISGQSLNIGELRGFLKGKLPVYMLPSVFELLDKMPLNANRKVDRKALPAPKKKIADPEKSYVAPRTEVEEKLASIWAELLQFSPIGMEDNFFALGGHSLMAIRVISRVRSHLGIELSLRTLFDNPTISELGAFIKANGNRNAAEAPIMAINRASVRARAVHK